MKKKYLVVCYFETEIDNRTLIVTSNEGLFDNIKDAEDRMYGMIEEESKHKEEDMFFEIKEVFTNKSYNPETDFRMWLKELLHIHTDSTYGDNVWRLAVAEKVEKVISNTEK